ncbi:MAG: hypothetical protein OK456_08510 [Thaumarchaeota archaeon]|nr:hypothetical protein [Nitrososphaerota archaeon]
MITNSPQMAATGSSGGRGNEQAASLWLGYAPTGGKVRLGFEELRGKLLISGHSADSVAALFAYSCGQADLKTLVLDADGHLAERVSGYFETYDYSWFIYDAFQFDEAEAPRHSQLMAAAYTAALDLSSEEEAIMSAAMQQVALKDNRASPAVLFGEVGGVEGFRGFYVDKLKGRIASLRYLEAAENGSFSTLLALGSALVTFKSAKYPQAMEVALAAYVAKLVSNLPNAKAKPDVIIINDAHRLFRANPTLHHAARLLTELLDADVTVVLVSDQVHALSDIVLNAFPLKLLSSELWNDRMRDYRYQRSAPEYEPVLPNAVVIEDGHFGHVRPFIPRMYEVRTSEPRSGPAFDATIKQADNNLTALILQDIAKYEAPTRPSLLGFLSAEYDSEVVKHELDRLENQQLIQQERKAVRKGGEDMLVYTLTEAGRRLMEAMGQ